jgi:hypothetical protein
MTALAFGIFAMLWLVVGGWAFRKLGESTDKRAIGVLFGMCVLLAPFLAGIAIAERSPKATLPNTQKEGT